MHQPNRLIDDPGPARVARVFAAHLAVEFPAVFTFPFDLTLDATSWKCGAPQFQLNAERFVTQS